MRIEGPTVGLLASSGLGGGMGLGDLSNMPTGVMNAPRLVRPPVFPHQINNQTKNTFSSSAGLTLGLPRGLEGVREMNSSLDGEKTKNKDEENESRSGSENLDGGSGEDQDPEPPNKKKRYHRHTIKQIQLMEGLFKECPHPDDKQRQELSKQLGLEPRQVKFWFQNRRTQLKAQQERHENTILRLEIEKLRQDNLTMHEAIRNVSCPNCGGPAGPLRDMGLEEQRLRVENACLKEELDRVVAVTAKLFGRPISSAISNPHPSQYSSGLDLSVGANQLMIPASPNYSHIPGPLPIEDVTSRQLGIESEKAGFLEQAVASMSEMVRMCQPDEPAWIPCPSGAREVLNYDEYIRQNPRALDKQFGFRTDATRASGLVAMSAIGIVDSLMDANKWMEMFPCLISRAVTLDVLSPGIPGTQNAVLQLMYAELQVVSPLVPTRELCFLRYCKQHADGVWAVADVSIDNLRSVDSLRANLPPVLRCRKRPSGYFIQELPNGYSKVTILEHVECDDRGVNQLFRTLVNSGMAFGAQRWLATMQRYYEGVNSLVVNNMNGRDFDVMLNSRQNFLKLAQRMTNSFCSGVGASTSYPWTTISNDRADDVRVTFRKNMSSHGEPNGLVLCAATSLWLHASHQRVFDYLKDEHVRHEFAPPNGSTMQEVAHIAKGQNPGNSVSLFRIEGSSTTDTLILQESSTDPSGSLVVYAPVEPSHVNAMMQGTDPAHVSVLPSGFAILPDGPENDLLGHDDPICIDSTRSNGVLLTVAIQILLNAMPASKLNYESIVGINSLLDSVIQKIKDAVVN